MSTFYFIIQQTMFFSVPLLIVGLGGLYSERSGVSNIGLEGIMIMGAFTGVAALNSLEGILTGQLLFIAAIIIAGISGLLYSLLHAWASIRLKADQTISGTALNIFAPAFCVFLARIIYGVKQVGFADRYRIESVPVLSKIPFIGNCFFTNTYISTYIGIVILIVLAVLLKKTRFGLRLCACGENPDSAASVGISVTKMRLCGVAISGFLGGMGGIIFVVPTSTNFDGSVSGYGFLALAVLILGQWKTSGILLASFFFGFLKAFASSYSGIAALANLDIPSEIYKMIPYVLTIVVLAISSEKSHAPKAAGIPYDDGGGPSASANGGKKNRKWLYAAIAAFVIFNAVIILSGNSGKGRSGVSQGYGAEIALCINSSASVDDKSFTQNEWQGIIDFSERNGMTRKYYVAQDASQEANRKVMEIAIKGNAKAVIAGSSEFENVVYDIQDKYPEQKIILVDAIPKSSKNGDLKIGENTICFKVAEQQGGFLAGYAAVMDGYRNIGFFGGMAVPAVKRYGYGYVAGADYAAKELGLNKGDVKIKYTYTGTFAASPEILAMASSWYKGGTEVIFSCGGPIGNSVMKAAESTGKKVIGVDSDQSGESPTVITSSVKETGQALKVLLESNLIDGEETGRGEMIELTAADYVIGLPMETSRFRQFTNEQYESIYERLASGSIEVPDDLSAEGVEDIPVSFVSVKVIE